MKRVQHVRRRQRTKRSACLGSPPLAALLLLSLHGGCVSERAPVGPPENSAECVLPLDALRQGAVPVLIRNHAFLPDTVRVRPGGTVVWVNCEAQAVDAHTATAFGGSWGSPLLRRGEAYVQTFATAGDHDYFCQPHSVMRGVVRVE